MKYKGDRFRLYGSPEDNKLFDHCKSILQGWKYRNRAELRALKLANKKRLTGCQPRSLTLGEQVLV